MSDMPLTRDMLLSLNGASDLEFSPIFVAGVYIVLIALLSEIIASAWRFSHGRVLKVQSLMRRKKKNVLNGIRVGELFIFPDKEIGRGDKETVVFKGLYCGRPVAVKRYPKESFDFAMKEHRRLFAVPQHQHLIQWHAYKWCRGFMYNAFELCTCNLHELILAYQGTLGKRNVNYSLTLDLIKNYKLWDSGFPSCHLLKIMRDIVDGLAYIHVNRAMRINLKPENIFIVKNKSTLTAKVSGMSSSKVDKGPRKAYGVGSCECAAEMISTDLLNLGCILFFCMTGENPLDETLPLRSHIMKATPNLSLLDNIPEALDLISAVLHSDPELRPGATKVLHHPLFWNPERRLLFLYDASKCVEDLEDDSEMLKALEKTGNVVFGGMWFEKMDTALVLDIIRRGYCRFDSVHELLYVICGYLKIYHILPREIQEILGEMHEGIDNYFRSRFPYLLIEVYNVLKTHCGKEEWIHYSKYFKY